MYMQDVLSAETYTIKSPFYEIFGIPHNRLNIAKIGLILNTRWSGTESIMCNRKIVFVACATKPQHEFPKEKKIRVKSISFLERYILFLENTSYYQNTIKRSIQEPKFQTGNPDSNYKVELPWYPKYVNNTWSQILRSRHRH